MSTVITADLEAVHELATIDFLSAQDLEFLKWILPYKSITVKLEAIRNAD